MMLYIQQQLKGKSSSDAPEAQTKAISTVYENGNDYIFKVAFKDAVTKATPGIKAQASVSYGTNGTFFSNVVEYTAAN